ncbi:hypothetical protein FB565_008912 [Actinoplanes lutulentus]|uniref:Uncharacterized protein n=1 Tax=Actinoplanes lutulentus TaxID=1287878 RepID=A0A327ZA82_9ACTN|nr:hypothetical protein [Actinoplanes lutulentus]MBB2949107.1 hypothetical protein [Actinoplanes lutulentus]RAK31428.1 hypothetical protein B0I29_115235 [Actinoplanes lutulentus]
MTNALGPLRLYAGLAVVFFGLVPAVMVSLLVAGGNTPSAVGYTLIGGIPLVLAAVVLAVRGMTGADQEMAARRLYLSMALVAGADVLMLGGNALIRMGSN